MNRNSGRPGRRGGGGNACRARRCPAESGRFHMRALQRSQDCSQDRTPNTLQQRLRDQWRADQLGRELSDGLNGLAEWAFATQGTSGTLLARCETCFTRPEASVRRQYYRVAGGDGTRPDREGAVSQDRHPPIGQMRCTSCCEMAAISVFNLGLLARSQRSKFKVHKLRRLLRRPLMSAREWEDARTGR
jgi:hypothetical protein